MDILFGYGVSFVFGLVIGAVIFWFYSMGSESGKAAKELEELKGEHTAYRAKVDTHFQQTAELFKDLTDRYRDVYKHMASGADALCSEEVKKLQSELGTSKLLIDAETVETAPASEAKPKQKASEAAPQAKKQAKPASTSEAEDDPMQPKDHAPPRQQSAQSAKQKPKTSEEAKREISDEDTDDLPLASEVEVPSEVRAACKKKSEKTTGVNIH